MDGAPACGIGRRGVRFGNLLDRTRFSQRPSGINWRGGASHKHARALGGALGACRYRLLRLFYVFPVLRRARTFARRQGQPTLIGLPLPRSRDPIVQFFILWFVTVFFFFSFSDTKRDLYLLPLLPTLALFLGKYFDDLASGKLAQDTAFRWLTGSFFIIVAFIGFSLPPAAWFMRRDAFSAVFPASIALLASGACAAIFIRRRQPLMLAASVAAMMALTVIGASISIMPYLENFKSPRPFAQKVMGIVPPTAPIYIYADTMNDFNYYTGREVIPVLPAASAVDAWLARG